MKKTLLSAALAIISLCASAQSELKTKSISIFKNGQSFVIKKGNIKTTNKSYILTETPNALFGTLWFNSQNSKINQVTSKLDSVGTTIEKQAINFPQLLFANIGKQLTITTSDNKAYTGIVESFESPESPIAIVKTDSKWISIAPSSIKNIEFNYKPQTIAKLVNKENKPIFDIQFDNDGSQVLEMMYLQNGIAWVPTYLLELLSDTKAQIKLQAEISNNAENLTNTDINLVVGVPNFKYASQPATLLSFLAGIEPRTEYSRNNMLMGQMMSNGYVDKRMSEVSVTTDNNDNPDATGDFYFYPIKNLTLPKNGRGSYSLFDNTINIKHIYECILSDANNSSNNYNASYSFEPKTSDVYHTIEIQNDSKTPFTTGSILIIDQKTQRPLAEDMLKYTPTNGSSSIKLTTSPDIKVIEQEKIMKTVDETKKINGYDRNYKLVTIESEVTIVNSKRENIAMLIKKTVIGKSTKASIKYNSRQIPQKDSSDIDPIDYLDFNLNIKTAQTYKFTYTYEKYIRL